MKKLIKTGKKTLAFCLTIMMVVTTCVFFAPTSFAADEATYTCENCGGELVLASTDYKAATHTNTGLNDAKCSVCGHSQWVTLPIIEEHQWDYLNIVEPTCAQEGHADLRVCTVPGCSVHELNVVLPKLPHTVVEVEEVAATCTEDGKTAGSYCSACGEVLEGLEVIPALGHKEVVDKGFAATCTEDGLTDGSHCEVCGEALVAQEVIPAKGHTDENHNGYCDECKVLYCDCFHHKIFTNKFYKVIYKIVVVFWKLFGINQTCACGQKHYSSIF